MGEYSPNRADAWIWVLTELFPGVVRAKKGDKKYETMPRKTNGIMSRHSGGNWMG
jgi:hypothetical protein